MGVKIASYRCDWCGKKHSGPDLPGGWHIRSRNNMRWWGLRPLLCWCFCSDQCMENWRKDSIARAVSRYQVKEMIDKGQVEK